MGTILTTVDGWIIGNIVRLRQRLNLLGSLDEDAFQDAYLNLAQEYGTAETADTLEQAFLKAYRRIRNRNIGDAFMTVRPDELYFTLLASEDPEPMEQEEEPDDLTPLARRIERHIRSTFPRREVMVFEMRMKGFSFRDISDTLGIGVKGICSTTRKITERTRLRFAAAL